MRKKILYLSLFLILGLTIVSLPNTKARLILELDVVDEFGNPTDLPSFVGKKFTFKFTCVTKELTVRVIMYFDGLSTQPVFDEAADFFINHEVTVDTVEAELLAGVEHTFSIVADDGIEIERIDTQMTVDIIDPMFTYISLTHVDADGKRELITDGDVDLHPNEYLLLNWTAIDEHMKGVKIYRDSLTDEIYYANSAGTLLSPAHFAITTPNVFEQTFTLKIVAIDKAGNTAVMEWDIRTIKPDTPYVPQEDLEKLKIVESEKRKMEQSGLLTGIILIGGIGGIILGILGANFGRSRVRGYMGTGVSSPFKKKEKQQPDELTTRQLIRKHLLSKFTLFILGTTLTFAMWALFGWVFIRYITPNLFDFSSIEIEEILEIGSGYFWQSFMSGFIWSFPVFCSITFFASFITGKGKFDELYVQMLPKGDSKINCKVISVFEDTDGDTKIATSSFVDAVNGNYLKINYRDIERLRFKLWVEDEVYTGIYIPALDTKVTIDGVEIDVFKIHGAACIQELIDSKDSRDMGSKFVLITELQKLSEENTELIRLLTKSIYAGGQEAAEEFKIFIEDVEELVSGQVIRDKVREEFERKMKEKNIPVFDQKDESQDQQPAEPPSTNGANTNVS